MKSTSFGHRLAAGAALPLSLLAAHAHAQGVPVAPPPAAPAVAAPAALPASAPRATSDTRGTARATPPGTAQDPIAVSLAEAVERALRVGDEVQLAEAQIDATNAQVTTARAAGLPQLRLTGNYTHVLANARASIVGNIFLQNYNYTGQANLQQSLFQGGRIVAGSRVAARAREASRYDLEEARAQLAVDVQRAYLAASAADQLVALQERNLELSAERVTQVEQLERAGRAARYDVLRARVERANLEPQLIQARNDRDLAQLELKRLLNLPPTRPLVLTTTVPTDTARVLAALGAAEADGGAEDAPRAAGRAAVRSAEASVAAREAGIRVARADFLPTVNVFLNTGVLALPTANVLPTRWGQTSNALCPPGSPATRVCQNNGFFADRSWGLQIAWPLFDGLRAKGNLDAAQAQARVADVQLVQARERVALEIERARAGVSRARALWQAQRATVADADEAFRLATLRFQRGLGTQLEVSDAQLQLLTARTNALRATYDVYLAAAEQARALGKPVPLP